MRIGIRWAPSRSGLAGLLCAALAAVAVAASAVPVGAAAVSMVTIDRTGRVAGDGTVTLTGSYRCLADTAERTVYVSADLRQKDKNTGIGSTTAVCDGRTRRWVNSSRPAGRPFAPGAARVESMLMRMEDSSGIPLPEFLATNEQGITLNRQR